MRNQTLSRAVKLALLSAGAVTIASPALAQDGGVEEVVVTGTRIQRVDLDAVSPVISVDASEFALSGAINVETKLNELPNTLPSFGPSSNNPGDGTARVNLRGLGDTRTLVLVNGKRWIPATQSGIVDLNSIPGTLIERVDILTGGASAVYGSDALAGVVNFQMKRDFEGVEVTGLYETTSDTDADKYNIDFTIGGNFANGKGNAVLYGSYFRRDALFQGDRGFSDVALTESDADGDGIADELIAGGSSGIPGTRLFNLPGPFVCPDSGDTLGRFGENGECLTFTGADRFNYAPDNFLQLPQQRYLINGFAHYDITEKTQIYGEFTGSNNKVPQELAPTPAFVSTLEVNPDSPFFSPETQAALGTPAVTTPVDIFDDDGELEFEAGDIIQNGRTDTNGDGVVDGDDNTFLPTIGRRMVENGSREAKDTRNGYRILAGVKGDITDEWGYDAYYIYNTLDGTNLLNNDVAESRFRQAVLTNDAGTQCADPSGGCVPMNIWGPGNISQAAVDFVNVGASNQTEITQDIYNLTIDGAFLTNRDAGPIAVAFGYEHRTDQSEFRPDEFLAAGDVLGFNAGESTQGKIQVDEAFLEVDVPILSGVRGAQDLGIWGAARSSWYTNIDQVWSYATAVRWTPIDAVRLRAGYQRAVRAPNINELFQGTANGFPSAVDPCSDTGSAAPDQNPSQALIDLCIDTGVAPSQVGSFTQANTQIEGVFGGNANLSEEESDTYTLGAVITPLDGLDITLDYFSIEIDDAIDTFGGGVGNTLDICYNVDTDINSPSCQAFVRRGDGNVDIVDARNANIGKLETSGLDFNVNYITGFDWGLFGNNSSLAVMFRSTYLDKYDITPVAGAPTKYECAGNFGQSFCNDVFPEFIQNTRLTWQTGPLGVSMLWRWIKGPQDESIDNSGVPSNEILVDELDDQSYVDMTFTYDVNDSFHVSLGIQNIFDEDPTELGDQQDQANTYPEMYNLFGTRGFVSFNYSWR